MKWHPRLADKAVPRPTVLIAHSFEHTRSPMPGRPNSDEFLPVSSNLFNRATPMPQASNFIVTQRRKANSYYQTIFECFPGVVNAGTKRDIVARSGEDDFAHPIR